MTILLNPFPSKGFPIVEPNRLALDRVKPISALSAHSAVKGLTDLIVRADSSTLKLYLVAKNIKVRYRVLVANLATNF